MADKRSSKTQSDAGADQIGDGREHDATSGSRARPSPEEAAGLSILGPSNVRGGAIGGVSDPVRDGSAGPLEHDEAPPAPASAAPSGDPADDLGGHGGYSLGQRDFGGTSYAADEREQTADHVGQSRRFLGDDTQADDAERHGRSLDTP